jgi:cell division protein FtsB
MNRFQSKISVLRIGIIASVIAAMLNVILLGTTFQRRSASKQIEADSQVLEENYAELIKVNQEQLDDLQNELSLINAEVSDLEESFPELGSSFALYQRAPGLSNKSNVDLRSISRLGSDLQETTSGPIFIDDYKIELRGALVDCFKFIEEIETAGMDTVVMQYASFWPEESLCSLEIKTTGIPPVLED